MSASQRGAVVGGIWLIALGGVFLVQQALDLPWSEAWPLFIVMAGLGVGASTIVGLWGHRANAWTVAVALIGPAILLVVGLLLFVDVAGIADLDALDVLATWWPLILIALGLFVLAGALSSRGRSVVDSLSIPAAGAASGEVTLKFGAGELEVVSGRPGILVDGIFEGGVVRRDRGPGRVELETDLAAVWPWFGQRVHWRVGLATDLPIALRLEGGASRSTLELGGLNVPTLIVKTGASDTRIALPSGVDRCDVRIEAGAAQVRVTVPAGVAARVRAQMGLGSTSVDESRFPRASGGWASPGYEVAERRADITIQGGVGSVRVS
jgi:hypothetical protein